MATPLGSRRATRCASSTRCQGKGRARIRLAAVPRHVLRSQAVRAAWPKGPRRWRTRAVEEVNGTGGAAGTSPRIPAAFRHANDLWSLSTPRCEIPRPTSAAGRAGELRLRHAAFSHSGFRRLRPSPTRKIRGGAVMKSDAALNPAASSRARIWWSCPHGGPAAARAHAEPAAAAAGVDGPCPGGRGRSPVRYMGTRQTSAASLETVRKSGVTSGGKGSRRFAR